MPEPLVVDDAKEYFRLHLDPGDAGVQGLRPVVVVSGHLQLIGEVRDGIILLYTITCISLESQKFGAWL